MKVCIESDGSMGGTRVLDQNGNDLTKKLAGVTFRHSAGGFPMAEIDLHFVGITANDTPARMIGPGGKEVRRIEYVDGTVDEFAGD